MVITSKWPGNCRDCGTRFAEGTQVEWQKGKGASCCNVRTAVRREPSPDGRHRLPVAYLPFGGTTEGRNPEWEPTNYPQADPQDMTSAEMGDALTGPGTITTPWN